MNRIPLGVVMLAVCAAGAAAQDGAELYKKNCAACHAAGSQPGGPQPGAKAAASRTPDRDALKRMTPEAVLASLMSGMMVHQGATLSTAERRAVAEFVTGKSLSSTTGTDVRTPGLCSGTAHAFNPTTGPRWNGWGVDLVNSRFQPAAMAGLTADQVRSLKLKWAFGFPGANLAFAQPSVAGGRLFVGSVQGAVYSLDAATGCTYWTFQASSSVRTAITIGPAASGGASATRGPAAGGATGARAAPRQAAYFGDIQANVYAVDALTGELLWKTKVEDHSSARITGSPVLYEGRLYVPVSSVEEVAARNAKYECCRFRGSVVALDAPSGRQIWKTYSIAEEPKPTGKNKVGTQLWGPAGAAIWGAPSLDLKRKVLYAATGNAYSEPESGASDSVLALDMESGKLKWSRQVTANDFFTLSCLAPDRANCSDPPGPDVDFGHAPILRSLPGGRQPGAEAPERQILVIGQKSGMVYGLDPDNQGELVWQVRVGKGGALGGVQWGPAADDRVMYVAVSDVTGKPEEAGGLFALEIPTGKKVWNTRVPAGCTGQRHCTPAQSAAVTLIPGVVFSGAIDGHLRAYSTADGAVIWDFDTAQEFPTVNEVKARGGSLDGPGPIVVNGIVYVNSGYGLFYGKPGNVLLAFSVDGK